MLSSFVFNLVILAYIGIHAYFIMFSNKKKYFAIFLLEKRQIKKIAQNSLDRIIILLQESEKSKISFKYDEKK